MKQGAFLIVLLVFGVWGLADALHFYPRRGLEEASGGCVTTCRRPPRANSRPPI